MRPVHKANLPKNACVHILAGGFSPAAYTAAENAGLVVLSPEKCPVLPVPLQSHADMLFLHFGDGLAAVAQGQTELLSCFAKIGIHPAASIPLACGYPREAALNVCLMGKRALCNPRSAAPEIVGILQKKSFSMQSVRQGYTKCACAVVSDRALICEDEGIKKAAEAAGLDCLLIPPGFVRLDGYEYGFIGGCCGKISPDILLFYGDIKRHPQYENIRAFLRDHQVFPEILIPGDLYDIGGILPLTEQGREVVV